MSLVGNPRKATSYCPLSEQGHGIVEQKIRGRHRRPWNKHIFQLRCYGRPLDQRAVPQRLVDERASLLRATQSDRTGAALLRADREPMAPTRPVHLGELGFGVRFESMLN